MGDMLIQKILKKDYSELKDDIETVVAKKISNKIVAKKEEILDKIKNPEKKKEEPENKDNNDKK